ncbi:hypothetical protein LTR92_006052 [Exophiala xenobiotica]|nr:hypothetical protein LTR92_006052 [Exophiala xenobiotica]
MAVNNYPQPLSDRKQQQQQKQQHRWIGDRLGLKNWADHVKTWAASGGYNTDVKKDPKQRMDVTCKALTAATLSHAQDKVAHDDATRDVLVALQEKATVRDRDRKAEKRVFQAKLEHYTATLREPEEFGPQLDKSVIDHCRSRGPRWLLLLRWPGPNQTPA